MAIGNWGSDIVFRVSERQALTFQKFTRAVGTEWATHSRMGLKDQSEFLRPKLEDITFTMRVDATLGVRPRAMLDRLALLVERGEINSMVVGGRRVGRHRWKITNVSEEWDVVLNGGELLSANVSITMQEYV